MRSYMVVSMLIVVFVFHSLTEAHADEMNLFIISTGISLASGKPNNAFGEYENKNNQYSLRYAGERFGLRLDHSSGGDDAGNSYLTGDALFRAPADWIWPVNYAIAGIGIMIAREPLRTHGSYMNFHAMLGLEDPTLFGRAGGGIWFDHWSNGHIHQLIGWDGVPNPPRNVISIGVIFRN